GPGAARGRVGAADEEPERHGERLVRVAPGVGRAPAAVLVPGAARELAEADGLAGGAAAREGRAGEHDRVAVDAADGVGRGGAGARRDRLVERDGDRVTGVELAGGAAVGSRNRGGDDAELRAGDGGCRS